MSNDLAIDAISRCKALHIPIDKIGDRSEVNSFMVETDGGFWVITFKRNSYIGLDTIFMVAKPANDLQISFISGGLGKHIKRFDGSIENISMSMKYIYDGHPLSVDNFEEEIIFQMNGSISIILTHDASSLYDDSFSLRTIER